MPLEMNKTLRVRMRAGFLDAGRLGHMLGTVSFMLNGQNWTPVVWDDEEDPDFIKSAALEIEQTQWIPLAGNNLK